ncbi:C39 family peptidase [Intrasporangium oryzae]|uniref:C39 family peptidase n=1 Tax=Intrasporangium oryzae TaxID=412687 RepID=UPI00146F97DA|nr:C39 family peptidase [Intrasporangium oryzae]
MTERHVTLTLWEQDLAWSPTDPVAYADVHVDGAPEMAYLGRRWESPVVSSAFAATELIPSWNARTPAGSWLLVEARVGGADGWTPWVVMARWTEGDPEGDGSITRTTVPDQKHEVGHVATDSFVASALHPFTQWQLRLTGFVPAREGDAGSAPGWPEVTLVAAAVSAMEIEPGEPTSRPALPGGCEIAVPPLSQRRHVDTFPEWDNGGQSWCSPTSTTMLLAHWGVAPDADESAWVGHDIDPAVVHAVRRVFDRDYGAAGNWAFNTAYAGTRGLRAYVTRLRDLTEAEAFVAAGVPLVVSVSFTADELDGAGYDTRGHLLTIIGFTEDGDVVSNDPNSHQIASNEQVRAVFRRDQFERVWLGRDGGLAYVMHPRDVPLPPAPLEANWS